MDEHQVPVTQESDKGLYQDRRKMVSVMVASMTSTLEQALRAMSRSRKLPYMRQGKIDRRRLTQIAKSLSKEVFYKTRDGRTLDVAVEIIIDESGSMGQWLPVQLLALAIGEALYAIRVPFEITGTTTKYTGWNAPDLDGMTRTNPIIYNHYITFDEDWSTVRHRIVHTGKHNHNIDGEAIEYCAYRLARRRERRKVIFSLSDGQPCGGQDMDDELGQNIVRVCERCRKSGIEVYGFGILTKAPEEYYGKEFFMYLDDPQNFGSSFIRRLADVITGGQVRLM